VSEHRLDFTTDSWHVFMVCACGQLREDVTGVPIQLIVYEYRQHVADQPSRVVRGVDFSAERKSHA
jgi:hypothetical protein